MRKLAIIKGVGYGNRDVGIPVLWFTVNPDESSASLQVFGKDESYKIIRDSGVYNILELNNKPCWVEIDKNTIRFISIAWI